VFAQNTTSTLNSVPITGSSSNDKTTEEDSTEEVESNGNINGQNRTIQKNGEQNDNIQEGSAETSELDGDGDDVNSSSDKQDNKTQTTEDSNETSSSNDDESGQKYIDTFDSNDDNDGQTIIDEQHDEATNPQDQKIVIDSKKVNTMVETIVNKVIKTVETLNASGITGP
jgi:hypothetical protein